MTKKIVIISDNNIISTLEKGDKILRYNSIKNYYKKKYNKKNNDFIFRYQNSSQYLSKIYNNNELALFYRITDYLKYNDLIIYNYNNYPIRKISDFINIGMLSRNTITKIINKFLNDQIIFKIGNRKNNIYIVNYKYVFKGDNLNKAILNIKNNFETVIFN